VEVYLGLNLRHLKLDGGGEFISQVMIDYCTNKGICLEYSVPYISEHNPVSERAWRTLRTAKDAMLLDSKLPNRFWAEAMDTANYVRNRLPTHGRDITPEEVWSGIRPGLNHIRVFGNLTYAHIAKEKRIKSDLSRAWKGILVGYTDTAKQIKIWSTKTNSIHITGAYTVDECSRGFDLLSDNLLSSARTKLADRLTPDAPRKRGRPRKLRSDEELQVAHYERTNSESSSNNFKEAEEDMPAPPRKRGRPRKTPLLAEDSVKTTVAVRGVNRQKSEANPAVQSKQICHAVRGVSR